MGITFRTIICSTPVQFCVLSNLRAPFFCFPFRILVGGGEKASESVACWLGASSSIHENAFNKSRKSSYDVGMGMGLANIILMMVFSTTPAGYLMCHIPQTCKYPEVLGDSSAHKLFTFTTNLFIFVSCSYLVQPISWGVINRNAFSPPSRMRIVGGAPLSLKRKTIPMDSPFRATVSTISGTRSWR